MGRRRGGLLLGQRRRRRRRLPVVELGRGRGDIGKIQASKSRHWGRGHSSRAHSCRRVNASSNRLLLLLLLLFFIGLLPAAYHPSHSLQDVLRQHCLDVGPLYIVFHHNHATDVIRPTGYVDS